jgi:hypothetical protein
LISDGNFDDSRLTWFQRLSASIGRLLKFLICSASICPPEKYRQHAANYADPAPAANRSRARGFRPSSKLARPVAEELRDLYSICSASIWAPEKYRQHAVDCADPAPAANGSRAGGFMPSSKLARHLVAADLGDLYSHSSEHRDPPRMEQSDFRPDKKQAHGGAKAGWQQFFAKLEQV